VTFVWYVGSKSFPNLFYQMLREKLHKILFFVIWLVAHWEDILCSIFLSCCQHNISLHIVSIYRMRGFVCFLSFLTSHFDVMKLESCKSLHDFLLMVVCPFIFLIWHRSTAWRRRNGLSRGEINTTNLVIQSIGVDYQFIIVGRGEKFILGRWVGWWWMASIDIRRWVHIQLTFLFYHNKIGNEWEDEKSNYLRSIQWHEKRKVSWLYFVKTRKSIKKIA
jgi:hypothetical protein